MVIDSVAIVEIIIKLFQVFQDSLHVTGRVDKICNAEVIRALLLPETRAWHRHNSRLVHHFQTVNEVWLLTLLQCLINELLTEVYLWEAVHGTLNLRATHLLHVVECAGEELGTLLEATHYAIVLSLVLLDAFDGFTTEVRRVDHEIHGDLADSVGAELDRLELVEDLFGPV